MRSVARHATLALLAGSLLGPAAFAGGSNVRIVISSGGRHGSVFASGCGPRYAPPRPRHDYRPGGWTYRSDRRHHESYEERLCRAWDLLADECFYDAQCLFLDLTCERSYDASAHFGLALSYSVREDDESALHAMRTAFVLAPRGFCPPDVRGLDDVIECAAERYERIAKKRCEDPDVQFMLAAAEYLDGRERQARRAIEDAIELGDCSRAAENLACLVGAEPRRSYSRR